MSNTTVAQDGDAYALTETMTAIFVAHHAFPHPEPFDGWVHPSDLSEWIVPPETERSLRDLGYDHRDVHHVLYLVPYEDLGPMDVQEHRRLSRGAVTRAVAIDFPCTREDIAAVRALVAD